MNPLIGYENRLDEGTVVASDDPVSAPKENSFNWRLDDYWQPAAATSHQLDVDLGNANSADYLGFYSSNLYSEAGASVEILGDPFSPPTTIRGTITPTTRGPKFLQFTSGSYRYWRINISTTGNFSPKVQVVAFGDRLELQRGLRDGFMPPAIASRFKPVITTSENGIYLGRSLAVAPVEFDIEMSVLTPAWVRSNWPILRDHIEQFPFFVLPQPDDYPDEAVIAWTSKNVPMPRYSEAGYMEIDLNLKVFV